MKRLACFKITHSVTALNPKNPAASLPFCRSNTGTKSTKGGIGASMSQAFFSLLCLSSQGSCFGHRFLDKPSRIRVELRRFCSDFMLGLLCQD